ncbi:MAG: sulfurtransferase [Phycisphaerales bacterium]|nr:MAG: sulfurtransferase [Phycisphaerales bacterium]
MNPRREERSRPMKPRYILGFVILAGAALGLATIASTGQSKASTEQSVSSWSSLLTAEELYDQLLDHHLLVIDVRPQDQYAEGHIPGAINIPGVEWRTPGARPGEGDSQYIFRDSNDQMDIARYEELLSSYGVRNDHRIVIYGHHGGTANGSIPAMLLDMLGHDDVAFLDGIGVNEWQGYGLSLSTDATTLPRSRYRVESARTERMWNLDDVLKNLDNDEVVFHDTRSIDEFEGTSLRNNAYGGRIPGAQLLDYAAFFKDESHCTVDPQTAKAKLLEAGITPDKKVVLYCQTSTRVSLPYLIMKDLGYENIIVYDASWHEYGNRDDVPIENKVPRRQ